MTKQEIFDKVWTGLKAQGFQQSVSDDGLCKYRGLNGLKCAAGHLIPDDVYSPKMEGATADDLPWFRAEFNKEDLEFIFKLQLVHDEPDGDDDHMKRELTRFAKLNGLTINE